ncbi:hypothetical protein Tco_1558342, partial [Tanacetum coccineum]
LHLGFTIVVLDKQVEGMTKHKEVYVTPSHTKKVFANMKRPGKGFSRRVTPLFPTMMIQASEDMGEDSAAPSDSYSTPIISQPSSSKPQKKKLRRKQRKDNGPTELVTDEAHKVLDLEKAKTAQAKEIASLKKRVKSDFVSVADPVTTACEVVTTASVEIPNELTLAQTLIEIKTAKPKPVTTSVTTITSVRPRAKGIIFHDQEEQVPASTKTFSSSQSQLPQVKDKGKGKMAKPEKPLNKKDQVALDEEIATNSSDICRLFLLIQSFSTSFDTTC